MNDTLGEILGPTRSEDPWYWWRETLAGKRTPIDNNTPEQGYYRRRTTSGWEPVAYWYKDGELECLIGADRWFHKNPDEHIRLAIEAWPYISKYPVTQEAYEAVLAGGPWPDLDETVAEQLAENPRGRIGSNQPPADDTPEGLQAMIDSAVLGLEAYKEIADDETSAKAQSLRARLNELSGMADKLRIKLKAPHKEKAEAVDRKWQPLVKKAKDGAEKLRVLMRLWTNEKFRREQEERRKREAEERERQEEERERQEEEQRAADAAIAQGVPPSQMELSPPPPPPPPPAPPLAPAQIRGGYGRAASVTTITVYRVTDQDALYQAVKSHALVVKCLEDVAKSEGKLGRVHPGVTATEEKDVR